ncbi:hypothetical protein P253_02156 [Acinetobacter indicus CIP 110367]|uniref:VTT domain-containing protein n=1 Tax=Acinetobacter indicus CIP 110367 TaxID=1341679 RepID=V2UAP8_9GAMM|nr:hypothetical protein F956_00789 [Acinetobacter indicus ANC 4215]ESK47542.1 hypothetical protein P253_02156 [Acinetobacter indicus CIP 110367]
MLVYIGLFLSAFGAATLLPLQSEAVLVGLLSMKTYSVGFLLMVATFGNVLGSCVNWWLGLKIEMHKDKSWFPVKREQIIHAQALYAKYGSWTLLLSWVPIVGDPATLVSGILKEKFIRFLIIVTIAKGGRYFVIYLIYYNIFAI